MPVMWWERAHPLTFGGPFQFYIAKWGLSTSRPLLSGIECQWTDLLFPVA